MYDSLSILRHDYKYHLNTIGELVNNGDIAGIKRYLSSVQAQLPDNDLGYYCKNSVINALIGSYAERCAKENIGLDVQIALPKTLLITNYDMCIILGNLLENAVEACRKLELFDSENHRNAGKISLAVKTQGAHLAVMVENSFSGEAATEDDKSHTDRIPLSTKKNGGFGLRSVRAVAARYDGHIHTEWNSDTFTAYVLLKMQV